MNYVENRNEMLKLLPKNSKCAEVGVLSGVYSEKIIDIVNPSEIYLLDLFTGNCVSGDQDGLNIKNFDLDFEYNNLKNKYKDDNRVRLVKGFSYNSLKKFEDNYLDFVYIDSDHTFDGTFMELELSFYKVKSGGFILGHDYSEDFLMCKQAVDKFCTTYQQEIEFITINDGSPSYMIKVNKENKKFEHVLSNLILSKDLSMVSLQRFENMKSKIDYVLDNNIEGDVVETGIYKGGMIIFIFKYLQLFSEEISMYYHSRKIIPKRNVIACDSFVGLPEPSDVDFDLNGESARNFDFSYIACSKLNFLDNLDIFNIKEDEVRILEGWFKDTLSQIDNPISILRMDGDYYESTIDTLELLYDKVSVGGVIIIDDYKWWKGCKKAVHDFLTKRNIEVEINYTEGDVSEAWFIKK